MLGLRGSHALLNAGRWTGASLLLLAIVSAIAYLVFHSHIRSTNLTPQPASSTSGASRTLVAVEELIARYPPAPVPQSERMRALTMLDSIFREEHAPELPAVQHFFHRQIERAVQHMQTTSVATGATVWLIYNHGFVVRTSSATLCFDLVRPKYLPGLALSEDLMAKIVEQCDALFVSHAHADHAESFVARTFIDQGKPVVAPAQVGYRKALYDRITHFAPRAHVPQPLSIRGGRTRLQVIVYPGHQGYDVENNVVVITTPDGVTVAHTGDQWNRYADFEWIDQVADRLRVDILLPNDWTYDIARLVKGINPAVVIPGHFNELGHEIEKRQPYALSFERKSGSTRFGGSRGIGYPQSLVVMTWGESYHYERPAPAR